MKVSISELRNQAWASARGPRVRKAALWLVGIFVVIGVLGFLVAPPIARHVLENQLSDVLHRTVTITGLKINPYALSVTVQGLRIAERGAATPALSLDEIYADVSLMSVLRFAPVLSSLVLTKPQVQVVRIDGNRYNWSDLIDEFILKPRDPNEPLPRFALANIEVKNGDVDFDDRPEGIQHKVSAIELDIPFLSSLPVHQEINVEPKFSANVNGTALELLGKSKPFKDTHESTINVDIHGLDLTRYLKYIPGEMPVEVISAQLETDLDITFAQPQSGAPRVVLSGPVALTDVELHEASLLPLVKFSRLATQLRAIEPLAHRIEIAKVETQVPEMQLRRRPGEFNLAIFLASQLNSGKTDAAAAVPWSYKVDEVAIEIVKLDTLDERGAHPVHVVIDNAQINIREISSESDAVGHFEATAQTKPSSALTLTGDFALQPLQASGTLKLERVKVTPLWPFVEPFIALDAIDGELDIQSAFVYNTDPNATKAELKDAQATVRSLVLRQRTDKREVMRAPTLSFTGLETDLLAQNVTIGEVAATGGHIALRRDRDGVFNFQTWTVTVPEVTAPTPPQPQAKPWQALLKKLAIDRYAVTVEDEAAGPAATANIENLSLSASNLSTTKGQRSPIALKLTLNRTGSLDVNGPMVLDPFSVQFKVDARNFGIVPAEPYFERYVNGIVSGGDITANGDVAFEVLANGKAHGTFKGDITLANFVAVSKTGNEDLLRWKSFVLGGVDASLEPTKVVVAAVGLTDFYSRLVISPEGRLNLQGFMANDNQSAPDSAAHADAPALPVTKPAVTSPPGATTAAQSTGSDIQVGKITLTNGNVNFSDFFIKPNYSANITGLSGTIGAMTRDTAGDVDLHAKIDNTAPVDIAGKVNPLAKDLYLDIKADARDIELSPLSPYSAKYLGYGIEKGKLSMKVAYKLEGRKLSAENNVILNQLTFGDKVDSPTATQLPVLFAVALLKDSNGVIDINLPISGSIDDPQFSVGGIIVRVIVNLIVKAVTAPFALLGALFGGGSEELAYIEFAPGSASISAAGESKLKDLTKALTDRPALKLDVAGRVDAAEDREGLKKTLVDRKIKAQKLKDTVKGGTAAGAIDQITIEPTEYAKYLTAAYREEKFDKPRNVIGLVKDLPVPEMEQLMLANVQVTDEDLRMLANQRAQNIKDYLVDNGKISADRVFLVAPALSAEGIKDKGKPTRVDFSLK